MRITAILAGVFLSAAVFLAASSPVHAEAPQQLALGNSINISNEQIVLTAVNTQLQVAQKTSDQKSDPVLHTVVENETLTSIASQYQTTWQRLFAKNTNLSDPNVISVGDVLVIPKNDEQLTERVVQEPQPIVEEPSVPKPASAPKQSKPVVTASAPRGGSGGNTYSPGYCTWYVKNRRPDLPNNLGNANTWVARAAAQGIPTGSSPRAGAIGQQGMHVVYVESVNGDGTVTISEMNHAGWNVVDTRTVPASYFNYIY